MNNKVPKEVYTRQNFAYEQALKYSELVVNTAKYGGNVLSCKAARKYRQAWDIYRHYAQVYCNIVNIKYYKR